MPTLQAAAYRAGSPLTGPDGIPSWLPEVIVLNAAKQINIIGGHGVSPLFWTRWNQPRIRAALRSTGLLAERSVKRWRSRRLYAHWYRSAIWRPAPWWGYGHWAFGNFCPSSWTDIVILTSSRPFIRRVSPSPNAVA